MDKAKPVLEASIATLIEVTPAQLREMANLLELAVQRTYPTDTILVKFTDRITLAYKPAQRAVDYLREINPRLRDKELTYLENLVKKEDKETPTLNA